MKFKVLLTVACVFVLFSCKEEEETVKITDFEMEDVNSLWQLSRTNYVASSLDLDRLVSYNEDCYRIVMFNNDGTGIVYYQDGNHVYSAERRKTFTYKTEDGCHFEMKFENRVEHWGLAKYGPRIDQYMFYCDTVVYGKKAYMVNYAMELRADSALYVWAPELRGSDIKVPASRYCTNKELKGKYENASAGTYCFDFKAKNTFSVTIKDDNESFDKNGQYKIVEGEVDRLVLMCDDGSEISFDICFNDETCCILYDSSHCIVLWKK